MDSPPYRRYYGYRFRTCSVSEIRDMTLQEYGQQTVATTCDARSICRALVEQKLDIAVSHLVHVAFSRYLVSAIPYICAVLRENPNPDVAAICADRLGSLGLGSHGRFRRRAAEELQSFIAKRIEIGPDDHWDRAVLEAIQSGLELRPDLLDYYVAAANQALSPAGLDSLLRANWGPALVLVRDQVRTSMLTGFGE